MLTGHVQHFLAVSYSRRDGQAGGTRPGGCRQVQGKGVVCRVPREQCLAQEPHAPCGFSGDMDSTQGLSGLAGLPPAPAVACPSPTQQPSGPGTGNGSALPGPVLAGGTHLLPVPPARLPRTPPARKCWIQPKGTDLTPDTKAAFCLSVCPPACLPVHLSVHLSPCLSVSVSVSLSGQGCALTDHLGTRRQHPGLAWSVGT